MDVLPASEPGGLGLSSASLNPAPELRVLLVEDNPIVSRTLERLLSVFGCSVETFDSGKAGLKHLWDLDAAQIPHLIIVDLGLPDMDGAELAHQLRQKESFRASRLIVHTGKDRRDLSPTSLSHFDDVLPKPASGVDLQRLIATVKLEAR